MQTKTERYTTSTNLRNGVVAMEKDGWHVRQITEVWNVAWVVYERPERITISGPVTQLGFRPRRGDEVEAWLKRWRDEFEGLGPWHVLDQMLDDYREHADTGTPLDEAVEP